MGVITTCRLAEGTTFGPVPPTVTLTDPIVLIGHRTCDTPPDIHTVKMDLLAFSTGPAQLAEWVPYVQAARDHGEQNIEATIDEADNNLYFRVIRTIAANGELLVWYSDKLAARICVPDIGEDCIKDDSYCCPSCRETFIYPNCLRAHMRFRCRLRQQKQLMQKSPFEFIGDVINQIQSPAAVSLMFPQMMLANFRETAAALRTGASYSNLQTHSIENAGYGTSHDDSKTRSDNARELLQEKSDSNYVGSMSTKSALTKRKRHDCSSSDDESTAMRTKRRGKSESPGEVSVSELQEQIAGSRNRSNPDLNRSAFYQLANGGHVQVSSPPISSPSDRCDSQTGTPTASPSRTVLGTSPTGISGPTTEDIKLATVTDPQKAAALAAAMMGGVFMLPGLAAARAAATASLPLGLQHLERLRAAAAAAATAATVQHPVDLHQQPQMSAIERSFYPLPPSGGRHPQTPVNNNNDDDVNDDERFKRFDNEARIAASVNNAGLPSPPNYGLPATPAAAVNPRHGSLPFVYRNQNPMALDKMLQLFGGAAQPPSVANLPVATPTSANRQPSAAYLQPPPSAGPPVIPAPTAGAGGPVPSTFMSLNLSQNWCAKCNTSFRMTSDLVYHMRSHHKRDFDPVKRRKDDKLHCDVCGETFRERHHLTRHMTSHS